MYEFVLNNLSGFFLCFVGGIIGRLCGPGGLFNGICNYSKSGLSLRRILSHVAIHNIILYLHKIVGVKEGCMQF